MSEGKKKRKKNHAFARPSLELSPFMLSRLSNTVYRKACMCLERYAFLYCGVRAVIKA